MKIIDLSHTMHADMPVYPGTPSPTFTAACTLEQHGFVETMLHMTSHTGTHIDAPSHMIQGGKSLDELPAEKFFGLALIIDWPHCAGQRIEKQQLAQMRDKIARAEFVLFHTGHSKYWGQDAYFTGFTALTQEAAAYLGEFPLKGIGIDALSFDVPGEEEFPVHRILLEQGLILVENLRNLAEVKGEYCMFSALPLQFSQADGSPVRAVAIEMGNYLPVEE